MRLIYSALVTPEKECLNTTAEALCNRRNFADGADNRILKDLRCTVHAFDNLASGGVEPRELDVKNLVGFRDHPFNPAKLIASSNTDFGDVGGRAAQILGDALKRRHQLASLVHEALDLFGMAPGNEVDRNEYSRLSHYSNCSQGNKERE